MTFGQKLVSRYLPPVFLAAIVLAVFSAIQNMGPRSVIRRFHEAIYKDNDAELLSVMVDNSPNSALNISSLKRGVLYLAKEQYFPRSYSVEDHQKKVSVAVNYFNPDFQVYRTIEYIMVRRNGQCKVDAQATILNQLKWASDKNE